MEFDLDWKSIAGTVAPLAPKLGAVLGTAIGTSVAGPLGGGIGRSIGSLAGNALAEVFNVEPTPAAVGKAIAEDPDASQKIQQLEADRGEEIRAQAEVQIEALKQQTAQLHIGAADTQNARQANAGLWASRSPLAWGVAILGSVYTVGFFSILVFVLMHTDAVKENQILLFLLAALTTGQGQVVNYFFGSSAGSKDKDAALQGLASQAMVKPEPSPSVVDMVRAAVGKKR